MAPVAAQLLQHIRTNSHKPVHTQTCVVQQHKTAPAVLHDRVGGGGGCLFVHLEVVCFVKHRSVMAGGNGGFSHVK